MTVMRPSGCFGMVLNSERRKLLVSNPFGRLIIQIDVRYFDVVGQARRIDGKAVILRCDLYLSCSPIQHGLIRAAVTEAQFVSLATKGQAEQLQAETNPKDRFLAE